MELKALKMELKGMGNTELKGMDNGVQITQLIWFCAAFQEKTAAFFPL